MPNKTRPRKDAAPRVVFPPGTTYVDDSGREYQVFSAADMDAASLNLCRAFAFGAGKGSVVVVGNGGVETLSPDDFAVSGLGTPENPPAPRDLSTDERVRGYRATRPRFGKGE